MKVEDFCCDTDTDGVKWTSIRSAVKCPIGQFINIGYKDMSIWARSACI